MHRRQRRQQVFSWANSLLVAITGGTIALTFKEGHSLPRNQRIVLSVAIAVLGVFSLLWVNHHWQVEKNAATAVKSCDTVLGVPAVTEMPAADWTTMFALLLLTAAALASVWISV